MLIFAFLKVHKPHICKLLLFSTLFLLIFAVLKKDKIKADTFGSYRRDHHNPKVITYDELYRSIVYDKKPPKMCSALLGKTIYPLRLFFCI